MGVRTLSGSTGVRYNSAHSGSQGAAMVSCQLRQLYRNGANKCKISPVLQILHWCSWKICILTLTQL